MLALAAVGCADGASRLSPMAPSPVAEASAPAASATLAGWAAANGWSAMAADGRVAVADGVVVEGTDVVGGVSGNCPSRSLTVRGVPVAVTASTVFAAPLTCASLAPGTPIKVTGLLTQSAAGFAVTATSLASPQASAGRAPTPSRGGERVGGEGVVGAVRGSCPSLSLVVAGYSVQTSRETEFRSPCEALREGTKVSLEVEKHDDGSMVALWVEARP
jgi:Domain of unknown function (DUF5666)